MARMGVRYLVMRGRSHGRAEIAPVAHTGYDMIDTGPDKPPSPTESFGRKQRYVHIKGAMEGTVVEHWQGQVCFRAVSSAL